MNFRIGDYKTDGTRRERSRPVVRLSIPDQSEPVRLDVEGCVTLEISLISSCRTGSVGAPAHGKDASTTGLFMHSVTESGTADWGAILDAWASEARMSGDAERYIKQVRNTLMRLVEHAELSQIAELNRKVILDYLEHLKTYGARGRPASAKTLNNNLASIRSFCEWLKMSEIAPASWANPCDTIKPARTQSKEGRAFTPDEAWAIFEAAVGDETSEKPKSHKIRSPLYRTLMITGIRIGRARKLRVKDFELDRMPAILYLPPIAGHKKENREREVVIPEAERDYFLAAFRGRDPEDLAFENPTNHTLKLDARLAGVALQDKRDRGVGYHCFRRLVGTELNRIAGDAKLIQKQLGHSSVTTSLRHYVQTDNTRAQDAIEKLSATYSGKNPMLPVDKRAETAQGREADPNHSQVQQTIANRDGEGSKLRDLHPLEPPFASGGQPRPPTGQRRESEWAIQDSNLFSPTSRSRGEIVRLLEREVTLQEQRLELLRELLRESPQRTTHGTRTENNPTVRIEVREQARNSDQYAGGASRRDSLDHDRSA